MNNTMNKTNILVDFVICLFFGYIGLHKFYERKYSIGILYFFTLGLFSLGWIYDCIILGKQVYNFNKCSKSNITNATTNSNDYDKNSEDYLICNVAGVTFDNQDGSSRQKYIKDLDENDTLNLKHYIYEKKDALYVLDSKGHILGNIPHEFVPQIMKFINTCDELDISVDEKDYFMSKENEKIYYLRIRIDTI